MTRGSTTLPVTRFATLLTLTLLLGCKASDQPGGTDPDRGSGGAVASGGRSGSGGGSGGSSSGSSSSGGTTGSGGASGSGGSTSSGATGGSSAGTGGATSSGGSGPGATGGAGAPDAQTDTPAPADSAVDRGGSDRPGILSEGADYPGRPEVRICPKDWTHEQCCEFLCRCLNDLCTDSPKGKPGIASCKTWCPKLSNMAMRCHVYHCFESVSTGGGKDHDSHCGHAADQVAGGMCRADVYN
jgi:hypothetical protein